MRDNRYLRYARWLRSIYTTNLPIPHIIVSLLIRIYPYPGNYSTTIDGISYELDLRDLLQANLALDNAWSLSELKWWKFIARQSNTILDVGGHIGYFTFLAKQAAPDSWVHAFEPNPRMITQFQRHIELNQFEGVTLNQMAVTDQDTQITLHIRTLFEPGTTSIIDRPYTDQSIVVDAVTLDTYMDDNGLDSVDLTKIDIEGAEECALRGMETGLMSGRYGALFLSIHNTLLTNDERANIASILGEAGYIAYSHDTGVLIPSFVEDEFLGGEVIALRVEDLERLALVEKNGTIELPATAMTSF